MDWLFAPSGTCLPSSVYHYTTLTSYARLGPADVLLRISDGETASLPAHSVILSTFSPILRDTMSSTTKTVDPVTGLVVVPLEGDCTVDWMQTLTAMYMHMEGANDTDLWGAMLKERLDQDRSAAALHLLADKYDIPVVHKLARRTLLRSLKPQPGEPPHKHCGTLDPWMLASRAAQQSDADLLTRCMSTICEPLKTGCSIMAPAAHLTSSLGNVVSELVSEVNKAVVEIPAKLSSGETHRVMQIYMAAHLGTLQDRCDKLEISKAAVKAQLKNLRKWCYSQKHK